MLKLEFQDIWQTSLGNSNLSAPLVGSHDVAQLWAKLREIHEVQSSCGGEEKSPDSVPQRALAPAPNLCK